MRLKHWTCGRSPIGGALRAAFLGTLFGLSACGGGGGEVIVDDGGFPLGMIAEEDVSFDGVVAADERLEVRPPSRIDLRGNLPPIGNQGRQGSCVAWATGYCTKTAQEKKEMSWSIGSGDFNHLFSPAFIYNQRANRNDANPNNREGMVITDAMDIVIAKGCATLATMPYSDTNDTAQPSGAALAEAAGFKALSQRRFGSSTGILDADILDMKAWLFEKQYPIVIGIPVYDSFMQFRGGNSGVLTNLTGGSYLGGHALAVVGYDDDVGPGGSVLIANSWGVTWGASGFVWVPYSELVRVRARCHGLVDKANTGGSTPPPVLTDATNDVRTGAGTILTGETKNGTVGTLANDPADWWKFTVTAGSRATVSLTGLTSDVDVKLTDAAETRLAQSTLGGSSSESMTYTFAAAGTYYIKVYPYDDLQSPYALSLTVQAGETNDSPSGATSLALNTNFNGSVGGSDPRDWFTVNLTGGQVATFTLNGLTADIDLYVYAAGAATSGGSASFSSIAAGSSSEYISFTPSSTATWYVLVVPWGSATSSYTLRASQGAASVDLSAQSFSVGYTLFTGRVDVVVNSLVVANNGSSAAGAYKVRLGVSATNTAASTYWYNPSAPLWESSGLSAGFTDTWSSGSASIYTAGITPSGTYYLMFHVDPSNLIVESNENNNYIYGSSPVVPIP